MHITALPLAGLALIEPAVYRDDRGAFWDAVDPAALAAAGLAFRSAQTSHSQSAAGVLRGLHFQHPHTQAKLMRVIAGRAFDVAVDIRPGSPTFGRHHALTLDAAQARILYIGHGFAHGFVALGGDCELIYELSAPYAPDGQYAIRWNDPALAIDWPIDDPVLSARDRGAMTLADYRATFG